MKPGPRPTGWARSAPRVSQRASLEPSSPGAPDSPASATTTGVHAAHLASHYGRLTCVAGLTPGVAVASGSAVVDWLAPGGGVMAPGEALAGGGPAVPVGLGLAAGEAALVGLAAGGVAEPDGLAVAETVAVAVGDGSPGSSVSSGATGPLPGGGGSYSGRSGSPAADAVTVRLLCWPITSMKIGPRSNAISWPDSSKNRVRDSRSGFLQVPLIARPPVKTVAGPSPS